MRDVGTELFRAIFQADDDTRELWSAARRDLAATRFEIVTSIEEATSIPWELLRDPRTDTALALTAHSFVRAQPTRCEEQQGNVYGASQTRFNVALALLQSGRPRDALEYARAALRGYESYGESAAEMIQQTRQLIGRIEGQLGGG